MRIPFLLIVVLLLLSFTSRSQNQNCESLKNGTFFTYPKNTQEQWKTERNRDYQKETNLQTGDTSRWKISWQKDCRFTLKYISGGKDLKKEELAFVTEHILAFEINSETDDYYIFS